MSRRLLITISSASLLFGGLALAQTLENSSGPAAGGDVKPTTAQKQEGRSTEDQSTPPTGAGTSGIEAKPGTQSGAFPKSNMDSNEKPK
jgi:hypothetical protein